MDMHAPLKDLPNVRIDSIGHPMNQLTSVIEAFGLPESPKNNPVGKQKVLGWMNAEDIEVQGATYAVVMGPKHTARIHPPLELDDYLKFVPHYFSRCLKENPNGDWSHTRYAAAWDFASWFQSLWNDKKIDRSALAKLKIWLAREYTEGDEAIKRCIVNGALEHLFETRAIAKYFDDWATEPSLQSAYHDAAAWAQGKNNT